jgi:hypothetical protein
MNRREAEYLHLDIPNARSQIQRITAGFIGEGRDFGVALDCRDCRARQELVGCADRTALLRGRCRSIADENEGDEGEMKSHVCADAA